uniref:HTH La-type RNA-binding domain-containing protein n=1 Tax=Oryza rufipogon TaxID=4529 RepID=A0A0E0QZK8_ORYRU
MLLIRRIVATVGEATMVGMDRSTSSVSSRRHHIILLSPPPSFLTSPYFGAFHEPAIGYAPHSEHYGSMIGHAHPRFAFPLPQQKHNASHTVFGASTYGATGSTIDRRRAENNLCSDVYLKGWMNQQGWVPLTLVAGFPRVQALTTDYETVQRSVLSSTGVELQDSKIRRRMGWEKYILPISFTHEG